MRPACLYGATYNRRASNDAFGTKGIVSFHHALFRPHDAAHAHASSRKPLHSYILWRTRYSFSLRIGGAPNFFRWLSCGLVMVFSLHTLYPTCTEL